MERIKLLTFLLLGFLSCNKMQGQDLINELIPFELGNETIVQMLDSPSGILISVIYPDNNSAIIKRSLSGNINYFSFDEFVFSIEGIVFLDSHYYILGKDRTLLKGLKIAKLNENFELIWIRPFDTPYLYNFPSALIKDDQNLYASYMQKESVGDDEHTFSGLTKLDTSANIVFHQDFNKQDRYSYPDNTYFSLNNNIITSGIFSYIDEDFTRYANVYKFDKNGALLWEYRDPLDLEHGAVYVRSVELSDSTIVFRSSLDRFFEPEYVDNNWNYRPERLTFIDKDGNHIKDSLFHIPQNEDISFGGIESGKGDYFFYFGRFKLVNGNNEGFSFITKISNAGEEIWTTKFRHPDFPVDDNGHRMEKIVELENGNILTLNSILNPAVGSEMWLVELDPDGCSVNVECLENIVLPNKEIITSEIILFPNPTTGILHLEGTPIIDHILVHDLLGNEVLHIQENYIYNIDLSMLNNGVYFITGIKNGEPLFTSKIIKQ